MNKKQTTASVIGILSILLLLYLFRWYDVYNKENINKAIISEHLNEITYLEFQNYISENYDATIYIGISNDENAKLYENMFKNIVENYDLKEKVVYLNFKDININEFNEKYKGKFQITKTPAIIKFEDKKILDVFENNMTKENTIKFLKRNEIIDY